MFCMVLIRAYIGQHWEVRQKNLSRKKCKKEAVKQHILDNYAGKQLS